MLALLREDISTLLYPSKERALMLNKAYWTIVKEQSFIRGREANIKAATPLHLHKEVGDSSLTSIPYRTY
ncbi:MAG: hypothetical protein N2511_04690, partial [Thermodesulfovibrionales bacterium]|nr:hypothetical protein [Thermodesulfovibrionales bacterium]